VHEIPVPPAEATAAAPRLQRLFDHRHPALSPVLAWGTDQNGVWVAVEPNEGTPLSSILSRGPMTPPAAAALGAAVLSGVAALHETGIAMGGFGATAVRVTSNGDVRLAGHPAAAVRGAPSQSDLRADVRSCGMAVCAAFGVDPAGAPAPANIPPGLVVTMRSMASGAMGPSADRALGALREMAAPLLAPDRQMAAQSELATRAGGREVPAITPFLPGGTVAPAAQPAPSAPVAPVAAAAPPAPAPAPAPFLAPPRPDDQQAVRRSVYEPDDRPLQTYPSIPAVTFPPAPAPMPAPAAAAASAVETPPSAPVPTWAEAPPRSPAPIEEAAPAISTNPPAPRSEPAAPLPPIEPPAPAAPPAFITSPPAPAPPPAFITSPPAPAAAPAAEPASPAVPVAAAAAAPAAWTPVESPVWKPGEAVPAEPLGTGYAIEAPRLDPVPPAAPPAAVMPARVTSPPVERKQTVPRPDRPGRLGPSDRPAWLVPAAVAAVVIILLGVAGVVILPKLGGSNPVASTSPSARASSSPKASPKASPTGGGLQTVPTYAPATAAPVSKIQICTAEAPCAIPGGSPESGTTCDLTSCHIEVAVYFTSVQKSVPVAYALKFFDRCTGQSTDLQGTRTTTPSTGWIVAIPTDHLAVTIPSGVKSGAIVAVSSAPATAASAPLLLGADSC
jgi:hypothetical protein